MYWKVKVKLLEIFQKFDGLGTCFSTIIDRDGQEDTAWPASSVGSAPDCQSGDREFDPGQATYLCENRPWPFSPTSVSSRAVVSYWHKYVHLVLVTCLERLSMPRNSVSRLTDRRYMTERLLNTA